MSSQRTELDVLELVDDAAAPGPRRSPGSAAATAPNACLAAALISRPGTSLASGSSVDSPAATPGA